MNKTIYKQTDSRWASLPFPGGGSNIAGCGCGCLSVTHVLMEVPKYKNYTPKNVQPYMKKWAVRNQGLIHEGIGDSLKHFGMDVIFVSEADPMDKAWKYLDKGLYNDGVLLFYGYITVKGKRKYLYGPDGTQWTSGGHFIAFTGYKKVGKKHWFYLKDSGLRQSRHVNIKGKRVTESHSGWWCYEDSMKSCIPKLWLAKIPGAKNEKKSEKKVATKPKTVDYGQLIVDKCKEYAWPKGTDEKFWKYKYKSAKPTSAYKKAAKKYMNKSSRVTLSDCGYFVSTCVRAAGVSKTFNALAWSNKIPKTLKVVHKGKKIDPKTLKPGDIIRYKKESKRSNGKYEQHTMIYFGNGYVCEAGRKVRFGIIRKDTQRYNGDNIQHKTIQVLRAVGKEGK